MSDEEDDVEGQGSEATPPPPAQEQPQVVLPSWLNTLGNPNGASFGAPQTTLDVGPSTLSLQGAPVDLSPNGTVQTSPTGHQFVAPPMPGGPAQLTPEQRKAQGLADVSAATQEGAASIGREADAAKQLGEARQQGATDATAILDKKGAAQAANADEMQKRFAAQAQAVDSKQKDADAASKAYQDYHVDQNRIWHQASTGQKALAMVGILLSGVGMAMARKPGENPALDMVQKMAEQDTQLQLADQAKLGDVAKTKRSAVSEIQSRFANENAQANVLTAAKMERFATDLQRSAVVQGGAEAKQTAAMTAEAINQKASQLKLGAAQYEVSDARQDIQQKIQKQQHDEEMGQRAAQFAATQKLEREKMEMQREEKQDALDAKTGSLARDQGVQSLDGSGFLKNKDGTAYIAPKEEAKDIHEMSGATRETVAALDKIRGLRSKFGSEEQFENFLVTDEAGRKINQEMARVIVGMHAQMGIKRFSPDVVELAEKSATGGLDPKSLRAVLPQLDNAREDVLDRMDQRLRGANYDGPKVDIPDPMEHRNIDQSPEEREAATQHESEHTSTRRQIYDAVVNNPANPVTQARWITEHVPKIFGAD